jgi:hypothetical protein
VATSTPQRLSATFPPCLGVPRSGTVGQVLARDDVEIIVRLERPRCACGRGQRRGQRITLEWDSGRPYSRRPLLRSYSSAVRRIPPRLRLADGPADGRTIAYTRGALTGLHKAITDGIEVLRYLTPIGAGQRRMGFLPAHFRCDRGRSRHVRPFVQTGSAVARGCRLVRRGGSATDPADVGGHGRRAGSPTPSAAESVISAAVGVSTRERPRGAHPG